MVAPQPPEENFTQWTKPYQMKAYVVTRVCRRAFIIIFKCFCNTFFGIAGNKIITKSSQENDNQIITGAVTCIYFLRMPLFFFTSETVDIYA